MTQTTLTISEQIRVWFLERDARAYPALSEFCIEAAKRKGAGPDAEDLAQGLLLDLLRLRDCGRFEPASAAEFESYLHVCLNRRRINLWRRHGRRHSEGQVDDFAGSADAPDAAIRASEHIELCVQLIEHALTCAGGAAATHEVVSRIIARYVPGLDIEDVLIRSGLIDESASEEQRRQERNNENRRQSRARVAMLDALHELADSASATDATCWLNAGVRRVPFNSEDVRSALRFAMSLGRCESPGNRSRKGKR